jgi:hypothetical protein
MKNLLMVGLLVVVWGCSYSAEKYIEDPKTILQDPFSVNHQQALDDLEKAYLKKDINYADYLDQKRQLEEDYQKELQHREKMIRDY